MKVNDGKTVISFEEQDLALLDKFLKMGIVANEMKVLLRKGDALKKVAFGEVEIFCADNNLDTSNLEFDKEENRILIKKAEENPMMKILEDIGNL